MSVARQCEITRLESLSRQRPKPVDAQGRTVRYPVPTRGRSLLRPGQSDYQAESKANIGMKHGGVRQVSTSKRSHGKRLRHGRGRRPMADARADILSAAGRLLLKRGVAAFTIERVAREAAASRTTIYKW